MDVCMSLFHSVRETTTCNNCGLIQILCHIVHKNPSIATQARQVLLHICHHLSTVFV